MALFCVQDLSKSQKDHQEAIWELLQTELDYIRKVKVIIDVSAINSDGIDYL